MLYYLHYFWDLFKPLWIFKYVTVRAVAGAATAFLLVLILGPWVIRQLQRLKISQFERKEEAPPLYELHAKKEGTPTMGGIIIIGAILMSALLWVNPSNIFMWLAIATMLFMGLIGFVDDYTKLTNRSSKGLTARHKLILQILWGIIITTVLLNLPETSSRAQELAIPFVKAPKHMGIIFAYFFTTLVIVGACNAVNLTDGLDGLAIGCSGSVAFSYLVMAYAAGHAAFANYLLIPHIRGAEELAVLCGCMLGAYLGFLWYNCHPAKVFMGDTGSLSIGGTIAMIAILIKQELVLIIVGGVFVIEAFSVILQVASFKLRGKRIFAMAPLHHHFEMKKWSETQVTIRFWIISIIFALLGILTLKIR